MKKPIIGGIRLGGWAVMAPMAGVSDMAYRIIARQMGAALTTAEMVSAKGIYYRNEKTRDMLAIDQGEHPTAMQIFGSEPSIMAFGAQAAEAAGADIIDINMGCPMQKVVKNGDGAALMRNIPLAESVIRAVVQAVSVPVTVKMRLGWSRDTVNATELARVAEDAGASSLTVHGRTRDEFYTGKADLEEIARVVDSVDIPVFGNGDVTDGVTAKHMMEETGCAGVAVGRGAWGNPWVFHMINAYLETGEIILPPTWEEQLDMAEHHLCRLVKEKGEYMAVREMRAHAVRYVHGLPQASVLRRELMKTLSEKEFHDVLDRYREVRKMGAF